MTTNRTTTRILASLLVFAFAGLLLTGCDDGTTGSETEFSALEGEYQAECMDRCAQGGYAADECERACTALDVDPCHAQCLEEGGTDEECRVACAEEECDGAGLCYRECLEEGENEEVCRERCAEVDECYLVGLCYRECLEEGGTEEDCRLSCAGEEEPRE